MSIHGDTVHPKHGDVWEQRALREGIRSPRGWFSVMHVCGHHDPPHVTGYWHTERTNESIDPHQHDSIPLPAFLDSFALIDREYA